MPFTFWDIGACNCTGSAAACLPCALPPMNLSLVFQSSSIRGTFPMIAFQVTAGNWTASSTSVPGYSSIVFNISCTGTCTYFVATYTPSVGAPFQEYYDDPVGCSPYGPGGAGLFTITSSSCSPLSIIFAGPSGSQWTLTP